MTQEQRQLVSIIRGVHERLRFDYQSTGDEDRVWESHCRDTELRKRYADSMLRLATTIWPFKDRIEWCHRTLRQMSVLICTFLCRTYFYEGGLKRALRSLPSFDQNAESAMEHAFRLLQLPPGGKVRLLDVGSCYDPFSCYEDIEAVAVDLTPANEGVLECDFLKLKVTDHPGTQGSYVLTNPLAELPAGSFQVVVFCMVLEYLPCCLQRWTFCRKAAALLKPYGLLLVVTPDSKHQQRNAAMIRSWKEALSNLGLLKLRYEKRQHLHCMAFYRCGPAQELADDEAMAIEARKMHIPQDSRDYVALFSKVELEERDETEDGMLSESFSELPDCVDL
ncbi:unnamed protein product [Ixodes hexagonus]